MFELFRQCQLAAGTVTFNYPNMDWFVSGLHPLPGSRWVASKALVRSVYRLPRFSASHNQDTNQVPTPPHYPAALLSDWVLHKELSLSDGD